MQRRGISWDDYTVPGGAMTENFYARPGQWQLPDDHPSAQFRWNAPKAKGDPLEGLRFNSQKVEPVEEKGSEDPLEGLRWRHPKVHG